MKPSLIALLTAAALFTAACGSGSDEVATLESTEDTMVVNTAADVADGAVEGEDAMMTYAQCLRDQGIDVKDPVVDSEGILQKPEFLEGTNLKDPGFKTCAVHLEGMTFGFKDTDLTEYVDQLVALAACLRERGIDVDDPDLTAEGVGKAEFSKQFDFDDPKVQEALEECDADFGGGKK